MAKHGKEFKKAMRGSKIEKAQVGTKQSPVDQSPGPGWEWDPYMNQWVFGGMDYSQMEQKGTPSVPTKNPYDEIVGGLSKLTGEGTGVNPQTKAPTTEGTSSDIIPYLQAGVDVIGGISMIKEQRDAVRQAKQSAKLTGVQSAAASSRPMQQPKRQYVRPEDVIPQPEQMFPSYGVGTNVLAQDGTVIGGTPTEIQNMYNPGTLYTDLGYEPLNDTSKMKQYVAGGKLLKAAGGSNVDGGFDIGSLFSNQQIMGGVGQLIEGNSPEAGNRIGKGIGSAAGFAIGGPAGAAIGGLLGSAVGGLVDRSEEKIKKYQQEATRNIGNIMGQQMGVNIQNRFGNVMQDGGTTSPYEWVSHTWQPRTITTFGEHKLKDLLKPPADADMLRAGGHLKEYTPPSAAAMSTERPAMQMGGELQTHWGGYAEPMSYNPFLPDGGETIMFRGQSHDESDGRGNTGIGITYGENPVEVERGEPAVKLQDGGTGDSNLTVFGNINITKAFASMLGDSKAQGKKFKTYVADLSKQENKQNKLIEKSAEQVDDMNVQNSFDKLALGTLQVNIQGANAKLKDLAEKKMDAAALQNAINDTKEEDLLNVTDSGEVLAKKGANIPKAQKGLTARADVPKQAKTSLGYGNISRSNIEQMKANNSWYDWSKFNPANPEDVLEFQQAFNEKAKELGSPARLQEDSKLGQQTISARGLYDDRTITPLPRTTIPNLGYTLPTPSATPSATVKPTKTVSTKLDNSALLTSAMSQLANYLRPSDVEPLDPNQLIGELYALSTNQVEPVWAQKIQPQLSTPTDISLQDILNANQADYNATQRLTGYNPEALSILNAQKYQANQRVLGEQFRLNQAERQRVYEQNRNLLNKANVANLEILDRQQERQATALSKTKATTQEALNSISAKYAQNKLENRTLAVMENMYGYRFDPRFRAINMNPLMQFDTTIGGTSGRTATGGLAPGYEFTYNADGNIIGTRRSPKEETGRNGAILKALKNL